MRVGEMCRICNIHNHFPPKELKAVLSPVLVFWSFVLKHNRSKHECGCSAFSSGYL